MIAAAERVMTSEALVDELQQESRELFSRKSALLDHVQAISSAAAAAVTEKGVSRVVSDSPSSFMSPASRDVANVLKSAVSSLAAAGELQTMEKQALVGELRDSQQQLEEAAVMIAELKQSASMWQELSQTLRDENHDLVAQVICPPRCRRLHRSRS